MKIRAVTTPVEELEVEALILAFAEPAADAGDFADLDEAAGGAIARALAAPRFGGKRGRTRVVSLSGVGARNAVLVGLGKPDAADAEAWRKAIAAAIGAATGHGCSTLGLGLAGSAIDDSATLAEIATEAAILTTYRYTVYKKPPEDDVEVASLDLVVATGDDKVDVSTAIERAETVARAASWARDLVNTPPADKRPPDLARMAEKMAGEAGLACRVFDAAKAADLGMRALLAVGQGSSVEPRMVILEHAPEAQADAKPVVLVGKGITFDTGGISLKPPATMDEMKADMSGAAAVLATMSAVAALDLPLRVIGVTPLAENMPGGNAYRPGDIVRGFSGKTIEVLNTDAEGRLVLADAIAWTCAELEPACVVDLATLTGACVVALGNDVAGLMDNDEELASQLIASGDAVGERVWRLPMFPIYEELIESKVADVKNTGGRWGGAITAAKFLQAFVSEDVSWAHLDIAGPAYATKSDSYRPQGGIGFGVRLLTHWLRQRSRD